jgi:hypothetical protein
VKREARSSLPASEFDALQKNNTNRPDAQAFWGIQARNLAKMSAAGVRIVLGTDGNTPYAAHVEMLDMVTAGMTPSGGAAEADYCESAAQRARPIAAFSSLLSVTTGNTLLAVASAIRRCASSGSKNRSVTACSTARRTTQR